MANIDDVLNALREIASALRKSGDSAAQELHGFYREARRMIWAWDNRQGLGMRAASITLAVNVDAAAEAGGSDEILIGSDEDFVVYEVRGYLSFNAWTSETALDATLGTNVSPRDRAYVKAANCKINLKVKDTKIPITDGETYDNLVLASILPEVGGLPLRFGGENRPSWVVPHGQQIQMTATLSITTAALVGGSSDYGVTLAGVYMTRPDGR